MNTEKRIRELLNEYAEKPQESLKGRVRERLAREKRAKVAAVRFRWAFFGVAAVAAVAVFLVTMPRVALADKLREVHSAIEKARTMHLTLTKESNGREKPVYWVWMEGAKSRRRRCDAANNDVTVVVKGGKMWTHAAGEQTAVEKPYDPSRSSADFDADVDALELAKKLTSPVPGQAPEDVRIESHADVGGRKTFAIVTDRLGGRTHAELVVDDKTKLPVSMVMNISSQDPNNGTVVVARGVWSFEFNERFDPWLFEPVFGPDVKIRSDKSRLAPEPVEADVSEPTAFVTLAGTECPPDVLFRIRYGDDDNRIGAVFEPAVGGRLDAVTGHGGFALRKGGSFIVADRVNRAVKEFDVHGNLVMWTQEPIELPTYVAAGPDRSVYATSGNGSTELSRIDDKGAIVWQLKAADVIPHNLNIRPEFGDLSVADDGSVSAQLPEQGWIITLTADGKFVSVRPAMATMADGRTIALAPVPEDAGSVDAVLFDNMGCVASKIRLSPISPTASLVRGDGVGRFGETIRDSLGYWYRVWIQQKTKRLDLGPALHITTDQVVTKYNPMGEPVAQGIVDGSPFGFPRAIAVDPDGTMYCIAYGKDWLEVVRYRLP